MGDPAALVESVTSNVGTAVSPAIAGEMQGEEGTRSRVTEKGVEKDEAVWRSLCGKCLLKSKLILNSPVLCPAAKISACMLGIICLSWLSKCS